MTRTLILGGSGMLGHKLFQLLRDRFEGVVCTLRGDRASTPLSAIPLLAGTDVLWGVDASDWPALEHLLRARRPEVVINALGIIKQRALASAVGPSIQINALLPHQLAATLEEWDGRLIHFGTDCVFSGRQGGYRETDVSDAADVYGKTKYLGEVAAATNALTIRSSIIGRELTHHHSLLDWFLAHNHGTVQGYQRAIYSGLTTNEMAEVVTLVLRKHRALHGLYHVASEPTSKHDLLTLLKDAYRLDVTIRPVTEPVIDLSLNGDRFAAATGYVAPEWRRLVTNLAADPTPYADWLASVR